jgi:alpha-1,2-glucosyltransferase
VLLVIHWFSPVHKFMLADNRHYTFYVWRKFFLKHRLAKFIPATLYVFQAWRCWTELRTLASSMFTYMEAG